MLKQIFAVASATVVATTLLTGAVALGANAWSNVYQPIDELYSDGTYLYVKLTTPPTFCTGDNRRGRIALNTDAGRTVQALALGAVLAKKNVQVYADTSSCGVFTGGFNLTGISISPTN